MATDRAALLSDESLKGAALCAALSSWADTWLAELFDHGAVGARTDGLALVAVGGYGRGELSPQSDLDVLLLHDGRGDIGSIAERIWYPIWDSGLKLGHSVRTIREALSLAESDLDTATAILDARHVAGDRRLTDDLVERSLERWRKRARRRLGELSRSVRDRHEQAGEVAFLLEPDLKNGRGGLRDVHALRWAQAARSVLLEGDDLALFGHYETLLSARVELHRIAGRPGDRLLLEAQDAVADALGDRDADEMMLRLATAARAIAWRSDEAWQRVDSSLAGPLGRLVSRDRSVGQGLILREGQIRLATGADLADPVITLRAAAAAARHAAHIERTTLDALTGVPPLGDPWPEEARTRLVELLLCGRSAIPVIEALDHHGLWQRMLPEWELVHSRPQRNAYHRFTVDRHLLETVANAAALTDRVDRPDVLVVGALLHDLGKGLPGDHTERGIELVERIASRMGFGVGDVALLVGMVRHHLLLPDVATRRDLADEGTLRHVADAAASVRMLRLLDALTEADSIATGPAAWNEWKADLVNLLVARTSHLLAGGSLDEIKPEGFPSSEQRASMADGQRHLVAEGDLLTVVDVDRPGLFSLVAGTFALSGIDVLEAAAWSDEGRALAQFRVQLREGEPIPWSRVLSDLTKVLDGRLALGAALAARARTRRAPRVRAAQPSPTRVLIENEVSLVATVVEVHTEDRLGVLHRLTSTFAELGLDIRSARVQTLGHEVVDSFYLLDAAGEKITDPERLSALEAAVVHALDQQA